MTPLHTENEIPFLKDFIFVCKKMSRNFVACNFFFKFTAKITFELACSLLEKVHGKCGIFPCDKIMYATRCCHATLPRLAFVNGDPKSFGALVSSRGVHCIALHLVHIFQLITRQRDIFRQSHLLRKHE